MTRDGAPRAREFAPNPRISFEVGDGASLAMIPDASADLVLSFTVFQHIPHVWVTERYIAEAGRVLRPGGILVFQWNNSPGAVRWALRREVLSLLRRAGLGLERFDRHAPAFLGSRVPLSRIRRSLEGAGLALRGTRGLDTLFAWAWAERVS